MGQVVNMEALKESTEKRLRGPVGGQKGCVVPSLAVGASSRNLGQYFLATSVCSTLLGQMGIFCTVMVEK